MRLIRPTQAYQSLRETNRDQKKLDWNHSDHPDYVAFKQLAAAVALIIGSEHADG